jgi:outer membrane protein assembly factor BamA
VEGRDRSLRETYVLSGHAQLQSTIGDDAVPYFLLPWLGGGRTLRGYSSFRFRDRHSLLLQAEFRWVPNLLGLDMALFWDAGTVAPERDRLSLGALRHDFGLGFRLHTQVATPIRFELAHSAEGFKLVMAARAAF